MSGAPPEGPRRRTSPRIPIESEVTLEHAGGKLTGAGRNINETAMLIATDELLPLGTEVTLRCLDDAGAEVIVEGRVTRHQPATAELPAGLVVTDRGAEDPGR